MTLLWLYIKAETRLTPTLTSSKTVSLQQGWAGHGWPHCPCLHGRRLTYCPVCELQQQEHQFNPSHHSLTSCSLYYSYIVPQFYSCLFLDGTQLCCLLNLVIVYVHASPCILKLLTTYRCNLYKLNCSYVIISTRNKVLPHYTGLTISGHRIF